MKREELKSTEIYALASEVYDDFGDVSSKQEYYRKEHADSVMDAMEQRIKELEAENARLKAQVPKWHKLDKPLYVDENGNDVWDLPNEDEADASGYVYTIHKCGARGTEQWDEIDPEVIAMWCELPTEPTERRSENDL